jgi:hypothetical protein
VFLKWERWKWHILADSFVHDASVARTRVAMPPSPLRDTRGFVLSVAVSSGWTKVNSWPLIHGGSSDVADVGRP